MRRRQQGLTKLEFGLVTILLAVLVGTFLYSVRQQQEQAERMSVELTVMSMRTGLLSEIADRLIKGRGDQAADLLGVNPIRFLKGPPPGYIGEFKEVDETRLQPGCWYFDLTAGEMVYRPNLSSGFRRLDGQTKKEIRWRIQPRNSSLSGAMTVDSLSLVSIINFEWF